MRRLAVSTWADFQTSTRTRANTRTQANTRILMSTKIIPTDTTRMGTMHSTRDSTSTGTTALRVNSMTRVISSMISGTTSSMRVHTTRPSTNKDSTTKTMVPTENTAIHHTSQQISTILTARVSTRCRTRFQKAPTALALYKHNRRRTRARCTRTKARLCHHYMSPTHQGRPRNHRFPSHQLLSRPRASIRAKQVYRASRGGLL